jgi:LacI family transcriptional regulator
VAKGAATIYDVAQLANVSIATVSRVSTGAARVRADTRERVEAAIAELAFVPSSAARGLSGGRRGSIALVYPLDEERSGTAPLREDNASVLYNDGIIRGATWQASLQGYLLFACAVRIDNGTEGTSIHQISSAVDGLILTDRAVRTVRSMRTATRMRAVQLSGSGQTKFGGSIQVDNEGGIRQTVVHLAYSHGVRSFGYVGGIADSHDAVARLRAFTQAVRDVGGTMEPRNSLIGDFSMTRAADVMSARLNDPTGLPQAFGVRQRPDGRRRRAHPSGPWLPRPRRHSSHRLLTTSPRQSDQPRANDCRPADLRPRRGRRHDGDGPARR